MRRLIALPLLWLCFALVTLGNSAISEFTTPFLSPQIYPQPPNVGLFANRPTFCSATGQTYYATDSLALYYSTVRGTSCTWTLVGGSAASPVASVFGRTGTIAAVSGDYTCALVTNCEPSQGAAPNQAVWYASTNCGTQTNCTPVLFDARWKFDGGLTNNSPTVTSVTMNFVAADVGKHIFTIDSDGLVKLNTTILSVQSTTSLTANANATATQSNDVIAICSDDTSALQAAWASAAGATLVLPSGNSCISAQPFYSSATNVPATGSYSVQGQGPGTTILFMPSFAWSSCTIGCFYGIAVSGFDSASFHYWGGVNDIRLTGLGNYFSGQNGTSLFNTSSAGGAIYRRIVLSGWCGPSGFVGMTLQNESAAYDLNFQPQPSLWCANQPNGVSGLIVVGPHVLVTNPIIAYTNGRGITFASGVTDVTLVGGLITSTGNSPGNNPHAGIGLLNAQGIRIYGTQVTEGANSTGCLDVDGTSTAWLFGFHCTTTATSDTGENVASGGILHLHGVINTITNGTGVTNAGAVFDDCGNSLGSYSGGGGFFGSCSASGTTQITGNIALTSGWDTSSVTAASGNSQREQFTITLAGTPFGPGVITVTFPTPFFAAPLCALADVGGTAASVPSSIVNGTISTTSAAFTVNFAAFPTTGTEIYQLACSN